MESAGELAFEFAEDAVCFVSEMGATAHGEYDAVQRGTALAASNFVNLYQAGGLLRRFECQIAVRLKGKRRADTDGICNTGNVHVQHQAPGLSTMYTDVPRAYEPCCGRNGTPYA